MHAALKKKSRRCRLYIFDATAAAVAAKKRKEHFLN
jgi:hypothetical protein